MLIIWCGRISAGRDKALDLIEQLAYVRKRLNRGVFESCRKNRLPHRLCARPTCSRVPESLSDLAELASGDRTAILFAKRAIERG